MPYPAPSTRARATQAEAGDDDDDDTEEEEVEKDDDDGGDGTDDDVPSMMMMMMMITMMMTIMLLPITMVSKERTIYTDTFIAMTCMSYASWKSKEAVHLVAVANSVQHTITRLTRKFPINLTERFSDLHCGYESRVQPSVPLSKFLLYVVAVVDVPTLVTRTLPVESLLRLAGKQTLAGMHP